MLKYSSEAKNYIHSWIKSTYKYYIWVSLNQDRRAGVRGWGLMEWSYGSYAELVLILYLLLSQKVFDGAVIVLSLAPMVASTVANGPSSPWDAISLIITLRIWRVKRIIDGKADKNSFSIKIQTQFPEIWKWHIKFTQHASGLLLLFFFSKGSHRCS